MALSAPPPPIAEIHDARQIANPWAGATGPHPLFEKQVRAESASSFAMKQRSATGQTKGRRAEAERSIATISRRGSEPIGAKTPASAKQKS